MQATSGLPCVFEAVGNERKGEMANELIAEGTPTPAIWFGGLGLIPFFAIALAAPFLEADQRRQATFALAAYGATILSFLGGVHWGAAITSPPKIRAQAVFVAQLGLSVVSPLLAWLALVLPAATGLLTLAVGLLAMLGIDVWSKRNGFIPAWYVRLRFPLSCCAGACLFARALWT